jgi:hypothetical protein
MKELTDVQKIESLEWVKDRPDSGGLCCRIIRGAVDLGHTTRKECKYLYHEYRAAQALIPEFYQIKPQDKKLFGYWFGSPSERNIPLRQAALEQLIEIIKSKP